MNYFGRLSTANTLTHYGKKGMKWHKRIDEETGRQYEVTDAETTRVTNNFYRI